MRNNHFRQWYSINVRVESEQFPRSYFILLGCFIFNTALSLEMLFSECTIYKNSILLIGFSYYDQGIENDNTRLACTMYLRI